MAGWVTHIIIAENVLERLPGLDREMYLTGSLAPDCNAVMPDGSFDPPREVTHFMDGRFKTEENAEHFWAVYGADRLISGADRSEISFLLGYYSHLYADALYFNFVRDEARVANAVKRMDPDAPPTWESYRALGGKQVLLDGISGFEADYLGSNPESGYVTVIEQLVCFPSYLPFLPPDRALEKVKLMTAARPQHHAAGGAVTADEYRGFISDTSHLITRAVTALMP